MTGGKRILKACFSLLLIQCFAWMQFTAAAHTHDHTSLDAPDTHSTTHHIHDAVDESPDHHDHGEHKDCPPEENHQDDDHQDEPHNCSVCILTAHSDEYELADVTDPAPDFAELISNIETVQAFEFESSNRIYFEINQYFVGQWQARPQSQRAPPYSI